MLLKIYNPSGKLVTATQDFSYSGSAMGEKTISSTLLSAQKLDLPPNSYTEFRGERYLVRNEPSIKRTSATGIRGDAFQTSIVFSSKQYELVDCDFMDYVLNDDMYYTGMDSFSFYGDVYDLCRRIQANLDGRYSGDGRWVILMPSKGYDDPQPVANIGWSDRVLESETLQISPSNENCWNALARSNSDFGFFFYLDTAKKLIYVGVEYPEFKVEDELITFEYGKGNGLYEIQRDVEANTVITKLRVKGSDRNIDRNYLRDESFPRFTQNLQLPVFRGTRHQARPTDYLLADQKLVDYFGVRPGNKTFDDIYPSITGMKDSGNNAIDEIHAIEQLDDTVAANGNLTQSYFYVYLYDLGFDVNEFLTSEDATMSMKTGYCAGIDFKIVEASPLSATEPYYSEGCRWKFRLEKDVTSSANYVIPSGNVKPKNGDKFVLLYILMPESYVTQAEERLEEAAQKYLDENSRSKISYTVNLDEIYLANRPVVAQALKEAISMRIVDNDLGDTEADDGSFYTVKSVQSLVITYKAEQQIPSYQITLAEKIVSNPISRIENEIRDIAENVQNNGSQNTVNRRNGVRNSRNLRALKDTVFDTDGYFNDEHLRPLSIETPYLAVGAKSRDFTTNGIEIKTYKSGEVFRASLSTGYINHRAYWWGGGDAPSEGSDQYTWGVNNSLDMELPGNDKMYYIYVKAERSSQLAGWHVSTEQLVFDFDINYYHFLLGVIFPASDDRRDVSFKYGMSYITGGAIYGDVIKSINYADDDSNEGSMYDLNNGKIRIGNKDNGGLDFNISEQDTLTAHKVVLNKAQIQERLDVVGDALLAGFYFNNQVIKSMAKTGDDPAMSIDGINAKIELVSENTKFISWNERVPIIEKILISASRTSALDTRAAITVAEAAGNGASGMSSQGVHSNRAGFSPMIGSTGSYGTELVSSFTGRIYGSYGKDTITGLPAAVTAFFGRIENASNNPAEGYGGWFDMLKANGFVRGMRMIEDYFPATTNIDKYTSLVVSASSQLKTIVLPADAYAGTEIKVRAYGSGTIRVTPPAGCVLLDDTSPNDYKDVGMGELGTCIYIGIRGGMGTWLFNKQGW